MFAPFLSHASRPPLLPLFLNRQLPELLLVLYYICGQNGPDLHFLVDENSVPSIYKLSISDCHLKTSQGCNLISERTSGLSLG